jgi:hypothetical protein
MPLIDKDNHTPPDHLSAIFNNWNTASVPAGELERLRAIKREVERLKSEVERPFITEIERGTPVPLETVLITGEVLNDLFRLL